MSVTLKNEAHLPHLLSFVSGAHYFFVSHNIIYNLIFINHFFVIDKKILLLYIVDINLVSIRYLIINTWRLSAMRSICIQ